MSSKNTHTLSIIWLLTIPQFMLGLGIADYLGHSIDWSVVGIGMIWLTVLGFTSVYLFQLSNEIHEIFDEIRYRLREPQYRNKILIAGFSVVVLLIILTMLIQQSLFTVSAGFIMLIIFLIGFFQGIKPFRLNFSGFGELSLALMVGFFVPALSLQLQIQDYHRLLTFSAIPITLLIFAALLINQVEDFGTEVRNEQRKLAARIGWENTFLLHNSFSVLAYLLIAVAGFLGMPAKITLPVFISFPIAGLQIWHVQQISGGGKPRWKFLRINSILIVSSVIFIFVFSFWIR